MKKKAIALIMAAAMIIGSIGPVSAFAAVTDAPDVFTVPVEAEQDSSSRDIFESSTEEWKDNSSPEDSVSEADTDLTVEEVGGEAKDKPSDEEIDGEAKDNSSVEEVAGEAKDKSSDEEAKDKSPDEEVDGETALSSSVEETAGTENTRVDSGEQDLVEEAEPGSDESVVHATVYASLPDEEVIPGEGEGESCDELFKGYVENAFDEETVSEGGAAGYAADTALTGNDLAVYNFIADQLPSIAAGNRASTVFEISPEDLGLDQTAWTAADLGVNALFDGDDYAEDALEAVDQLLSVDINKVIYVLLADHPYELYWYDKTTGTSFTNFGIYSDYDYDIDEYVVCPYGTMTLSFSVASAYSAGTYQVDTAIGQSVQTSVANAAAIVSKYADSTNTEKLIGYKNEICNLVSYNYDALAEDVEYGNPWQMIWVFDGDDSTNVICEGYSKAFKYLCDNTQFDGPINCILVTGLMDGGTGAGPHMWNILNMEDGNNYLADLTNCDEDTVGSPDKLFLVGTDEVLTTAEGDTGYLFSEIEIIYFYDENTISLYNASDLELCENNYLPHVHVWADEYTVDKEPTCSEEGSESIHCTVCGAINESTVRAIEKTPHTYGSWTVAKAATLDADGIRESACEVCGDKITEIIPKASDFSFSLSDTVFTYTGSEIMPDVYWNYTGSSAEEDLEISATVKYSNNVDAGTAVARVILDEDSYKDAEGNPIVVELPFTIEPFSIEGADLVLTTSAYTYTGSVRKPSVKTVDGMTLTAGTDYTIKYSNASSKNAGTYTVTVTGKGNYTGTSAKATYKINKASIASKKIVLTSTAYTYNGSVRRPAVKTVNGKALKSGTDYTIKYCNASAKNAGTYTVTVTGKGNYTGTSAKATYRINKASIASKKIVLTKTAYTYNGKVQKPTVKTVNGKALKSGTDYTIKYSNASSKNAGSYTVTVTGKGNYSGTSAKATYKINKAANPLTVKAKTAAVSFTSLKKASQTLAVSKVLTLTGRQGAATYVKAGGSASITINKTTGKVTVKKGLKKGTYSVKVKVTAAGNTNYKKSAVKTVVFKVVVK